MKVAKVEDISGLSALLAALNPVTLSTSGTGTGAVITANLAPGWTATGFQAYRDGVPIDGETGQSYTQRSGDSGRKIEIRATGLTYSASVTPAGAVAFNWSILQATPPVVAYGTRRMNPAATKFGRAKSTVGGNGTEVDMAFGSDDTALDALTAKVGSNGVANLVTWGDQSGNAWDAAIPDLTSTGYTRAPDISMGRKYGSGSQSPVPGISFDGVTNVSPKRLVIPTAATFSNQNCTVLMVRRRLVSSQSAVDFVLGGSATAIQMRTANPAYQARVGNTSTNLNPRKYPATRLSCIGFTFTAGQVRISDENGESTFTLNTSAETFAGGVIGDLLNGGAQGVQDMHAFLILPAAISSGAMAALRAELLLAYGADQDANVPAKRLIHPGDSRIEGTGASFGGTYTLFLDAALSSPAQSFNMGIYGEQFIAYTLGKYANEIAPLFKPGSVLSVAAGINDIVTAGVTGQQLFNAFATYGGNAKTTGFKTAMATLPGTGSLTTAQRAEVESFNSLMRSGWASICDVLVDLEADSRLSLNSGYPASYWSGDKIHFTSTGQQVWASLFAPPLSALLAG